MGSAAAASVATALAVLAVLAVLASATVAGVTYRAGSADDGPTAGPSTEATAGPTDASSEADPEPEVERFFPDGQVLTGDRRDNANIEIPSVDEGWTYETLFLGYQSADGEDTVGVNDPYVLDRGYCTAPSGFEESRAFVGLTAPISDGSGDDRPRQAASATVERWLPAIYDDEADYPEIDYVDAEVSDGTPAVTATFDFEVTEDRDRCSPPATELTFLAFETGEYVAVAVMSRGVRVGGGDLRGGLSGEDARQILASARVQQED